MRLDKAIASQGQYSRKEIKTLIRQGAVTVNGRVVTDPGTSVLPEAEEIAVGSVPLSYQKYVYWMMNKPKGVLCATEDKKQKTVLALLPADKRRPGIFPAGRLDMDTTGLVILTDDGNLAHRILSPKNHVLKTYLALLEHALTEKDVAALKEGILLKDGTRCLPAEVTPLEGTLIKLRICEGKYHQVKRMIAATGNKVLELKRIQMGNLSLDESLAEGACRPLTEEERELLLQKDESLG